MLALIQMVVAVEMLLLPLWVGAVFVRPPESAAVRLARLPAAGVVVAILLIGLAAFADPPRVGEVLQTQSLALGFAVLLAGVAAAADRAVGPRAAQGLTVLVGWLVLGGVVLAGPLTELLHDPTRAVLIRGVVHANPLVVAERSLGMDWLHQELTYRLTPIGESFGYLLRDVAWWKTLLAHTFVGSGLLVFCLPRSRQKSQPSPERHVK